jgi:CubicO group peptidase (beta-lactamase class C family)
LNFYKMEQEVRALMDERKTPGFAIAVIAEREIVYAKGFGATSVEAHGTPVVPETLFRFASVTKPMTGVLTMMLVNEGKLDLDTPISRYADWVRFSEPGVEHKITLRHLLSHKAGFPYAYDFSRYGHVRTPEEMVRHVLPELALNGAPGKFWVYSNVGTTMAAWLAELVTGKKYDDLMQERIFNPLSMSYSTFDPLVALTYSLALPHLLDKEGKVVANHDPLMAIGAMTSAGGILSNVLDVARFAIFNLNGGKVGDKELLPSELLKEMYRSHNHQPLVTDSHYGLLFSSQNYKDMFQVGHTGGLPGYGSRMVVVPEAGVGVVLVYTVTQDTGSAPDVLYNAIFDELLGRTPGVPVPQPIPADETRWEAYTGGYVGAESGVAVIKQQNGALQLVHNGDEYKLEAYRSDLYAARKDNGDYMTVGFMTEADGNVRYITVNEKVYERAELDPNFAPDLASWEALLGDYDAPGLPPISLQVQDGRLLLESKLESLTEPLRQFAPNIFTHKFGIIEFERDATDNVTGLTVARVWHYRKSREL